MERGCPVIFDDWEQVTGYDSKLRVELTQWHRAHESGFERTHILVGSRLLAMGVAVANLAVGGRLDVYSSRISFDAEVLRRVPGYSSLRAQNV